MFFRRGDENDAIALAFVVADDDGGVRLCFGLSCRCIVPGPSPLLSSLALCLLSSATGCVCPGATPRPTDAATASLRLDRIKYSTNRPTANPTAPLPLCPRLPRQVRAVIDAGVALLLQIALGNVLAWLRPTPFASDGALKVLNAFVFCVAIPSLMFKVRCASAAAAVTARAGAEKLEGDTPRAGLGVWMGSESWSPQKWLAGPSSTLAFFPHTRTRSDVHCRQAQTRTRTRRRRQWTVPRNRSHQYTPRRSHLPGARNSRLGQPRLALRRPLFRTAHRLCVRQPFGNVAHAQVARVGASGALRPTHFPPLPALRHARLGLPQQARCHWQLPAHVDWLNLDQHGYFWLVQGLSNLPLS